MLCVSVDEGRPSNLKSLWDSYFTNLCSCASMISVLFLKLILHIHCNILDDVISFQKKQCLDIRLFSNGLGCSILRHRNNFVGCPESEQNLF